MDRAPGENAACGLNGIVYGRPLADETQLGALTLSGYLREVTDKFAHREALVFYERGQVRRWSYAEVWQQSMQIARALRSMGAGRDTASVS